MDTGNKLNEFNQEKGVDLIKANTLIYDVSYVTVTRLLYPYNQIPECLVPNLGFRFPVD